MLNKILCLLEEKLGTGKVFGNNEIYFICPFCNHLMSKTPNKPRFAINIRKNGAWHCWTCSKGGKSYISLFRSLRYNEEYINKFYVFIKKGEGHKQFNEKSSEGFLELPREFIPLWKQNIVLLQYKNIIQYLRKRGVTEMDVMKYNIGFCDKGMYSNMIVIPSYDCNGSLNYFSTRSFNGERFIRNPNVSKNIIGFELFVNFSYPITIVEGPFDAIAVRRNVIPLFGKILSEKLIIKLLETKPPYINVCLDEDALSSSLQVIEFLLKNNIVVRFVKLPKDKDPSDIGFLEVTKYINSAEQMDFRRLISMKVEDIFK